MAPAGSRAQDEDEGEGDEEDEDSGAGWTTAISECCCLRDEGLEGPASGAVAFWPSESTICTRGSGLSADAEAPQLLTASSYEGRVTWTPSTMMDTGWPETPGSRLVVEEEQRKVCVCYFLVRLLSENAIASGFNYTMLVINWLWATTHRWRDLSFGCRSTNSTTRSRMRATELAVDATMDKAGIPRGKVGSRSARHKQLPWLSVKDFVTINLIIHTSSSPHLAPWGSWASFGCPIPHTDR